MLRRAGHDVVVLARSRGIDLSTGHGLDEALAGTEAVVDATSTNTLEREAVLRFFGGGTKNLLAAEQRAGVRHHLLLSILNVDRVEGNAHLAGKRLQEELVSSGTIPWTIVRAAQFHEFAEMVVAWTRKGDVASLPPLLLQPIAAADVSDALAAMATEAPQRRRVDLAGPQPEDFVDMARRALAARGESIRLVPTWRMLGFGSEYAGEVLLPGPDAKLAPTTFDAWLARQRPKSRVA
jgi:uncharacterized protein YbjT (DUF2867 family)